MGSQPGHQVARIYLNTVHAKQCSSSFRPVLYAENKKRMQPVPLFNAVNILYTLGLYYRSQLKNRNSGPRSKVSGL